LCSFSQRQFHLPLLQPRQQRFVLVFVLNIYIAVFFFFCFPFSFRLRKKKFPHSVYANTLPMTFISVLLFTVSEFGHLSISGLSLDITRYQDIKQGLGLVNCEFGHGKKWKLLLAMCLVSFSDMVHCGPKSLTGNLYLVTCFRLPQGFDGELILFWELKNSHLLIWSSDYVNRNRDPSLVKEIVLSL